MFSCRLKDVFYIERKLFSSAIYLNISNVSEENGIEESITTINKTLKRKISGRNFILSKWEILDCTVK